MLSRREFLQHSAILTLTSSGIFGFIRFIQPKSVKADRPQKHPLSLPFALHTPECRHGPAYPDPDVHHPYPIYMPVINA